MVNNSNINPIRFKSPATYSVNNQNNKPSFLWDGNNQQYDEIDYSNPTQYLPEKPILGDNVFGSIDAYKNKVNEAILNIKEFIKKMVDEINSKDKESKRIAKIDEEIKALKNIVAKFNVLINNLEEEAKKNNIVTDYAVSLGDRFPNALYDLSYAKAIDKKEYTYFLKYLVEIGIEGDPNLTYEVFLTNVDDGKYVEGMGGSSYELEASRHLTAMMGDIISYAKNETNLLGYNKGGFKQVSDYSYVAIIKGSFELESFMDTSLFTYDMEKAVEEMTETEAGALLGATYCNYAAILGYNATTLANEVFIAQNTNQIEAFKNSLEQGYYEKILSTYMDYDKVLQEAEKCLQQYLTDEKKDEKEYRSLILAIILKNLKYTDEYGNVKILKLPESFDPGGTNYDKLIGNALEQGAGGEIISSAAFQVDKNYIDEYVSITFDNFSKRQQEIIAEQKNARITIRALNSQIKYNEISKLFVPEVFENFDYNSFLDSNKSLIKEYSEEFEVMTEEEKKEFIFLYSEYGKDKAKEYKSCKEEEWNNRIGLMRATKWYETHIINREKDFSSMDDEEKLNYILSILSPDTQDVIRRGLGDGVANFGEGFVDLFNPDGIMSVGEFERMYIVMLLSSNWWLSGTYTVSSSVGNMLPAIAISAITTLATANPAIGATLGKILPASVITNLGPIAASLSIGVSSAGNTMEDSLQNGYGYGESMFFGFLSGASESVLGYFLSGIPGISKLNDIPGFKGFLLNLFKEGIEESTQTIANDLFKYMVFGESIEINWYEVLQSGFYGIVIAGIMNGGKILVGKTEITLDLERLKDPQYENELLQQIEEAKANAPNHYTNNNTNYNLESKNHNFLKYNTIEQDIIRLVNINDSDYRAGFTLSKLNYFLDPNSEYYGDYSFISNLRGEKYLFKKYSMNEVKAALNNLNTYDVVSVFGNSATSSYGVNQEGIANLCDYIYHGPDFVVTDSKGNVYQLSEGKVFDYRTATDIWNSNQNIVFEKKAVSLEYEYLKNKLVSQGFSEQDASIIMSTVDDLGACSYAATANEIVTAFIGREAEFEQKFGYSMYKIENGKKVLNSNELLLDLYVYCNRRSNGGMFINQDNTLNNYLLNGNRKDVLGKPLLNSSYQSFLSGLYTGKESTIISNFLSSKGVSYSSTWYFTNPSAYNISDQQFNDLVTEIRNQINGGQVVSMDIFVTGRDNQGNIITGNKINMISTNPTLYSSTSTEAWGSGGHAVFVTGMDSQYFYVSSWGEEYAIPLEDLKNGGIFNIYISSIY